MAGGGTRQFRVRWACEWPKALAMARAGAAAPEIARHLNRDVDDVRGKFRREGVTLPKADYRGPQRGVAIAAKLLHLETMRITPAQAADRDARREASYRRTQTQEFFGDPPPGYSALDRKRQEVGA